MNDDQIIRMDELCAFYQIDPSLIDMLVEYGLLEVQIVGEASYLHTEKILELERIVHLYYDLEINLEGIDTICHMLEREKSMLSEIRMLQSRLKFFESKAEDDDHFSKDLQH